MTDAHSQQRQTLAALALASPWLLPALRAARSLRLSSWCIGAGAVRNLVWDHLHGYAQPSWLPDVDLVYFDPAAADDGQERRLQTRLRQIMPTLNWEATNQATVHLWFEARFGQAVAPLASLEQAVASWPEYATAVGLWLDEDDGVQIIAPHGLDDLFAMRVRRNPARASLESYRQRVEEKRYRERWPQVSIEDA
nr:nucleotidyltransferase family protein [Chromobacterium sp. ASV5]